MRPYYYEEPYCRKITCTVKEVRHTEKTTEVLFDKTIFYPECGGQPGDCGTFGGYKILDTKKAENGDSIHIFEKDCKIKEGETQELILDWDYRYKYMVMHACQHLISGLLFTEFSIGTVAVHLGEDYLTIETDKSKIDEETLDKLIEIVNLKISENHKIVYHELSHSDAEKLGLRRSIKVDGDVRIVEIQDVDKIACGGVHVASTSEIRLVYCYSQELIRGHVRLFFRCGQDAINHLTSDSKTLGRIACLLTCSTKEIEVKLSSILTDFSQLKLRLKNAEKILAVSELDKNLVDGVGAFSTDIELSAFSDVIDNYSDICFCIVKDNKWIIVIKGKFEKLDFNTIRKTVLPIIDAKGGGRNPLFQGIGQNMSSKEEFFRAFLELVKQL